MAILPMAITSAETRLLNIIRPTGAVVTFVDAPCVSTVLKFSIRCEPGKSGIGDCKTSSGASDEATNVT